MQEMWVQSLVWEDALEKEIATHSYILTGRIPWTQEPGGLRSMGSQSWTRLRDSRRTVKSKHELDWCFLPVGVQETLH